jgi:alkyl sulfatase BDS1-like metallo-beta-lactamase superfamily hydrolase
LTNIEGYQAENPDLTLTIDRADLEMTMMGAKTLEAQIADGTAQVEGDPSVLAQLGAIMVEFDPRFPIMPGTALRQSEYPVHNPYEADPRKPIAE